MISAEEAQQWVKDYKALQGLLKQVEKDIRYACAKGEGTITVLIPKERMSIFCATLRELGFYLCYESEPRILDVQVQISW